MTEITPTTPTAAGAGAQQPQNPLGVLNKDDFLRLLVTQLKYQDPLSPTDNQQFMAQMAQFSTVEGINNLESTLASLQGVGLIGKQVTYAGDDGTEQTGVATAIAMSGTTTTVRVGADEVDLAKITSVSDPDPAATGAPGV
jgi:flagellar basal-body rod modification protein FlgD